MKYKSVPYRIFTILNMSFLSLFGLMCIIPYLNILATALSDNKHILEGAVGIIPKGFTLVNFKTVLNDSEILRAAGVSISRVLIATLVGLLVQFSVAYALTRRKLPGKKFIIAFLTVPMFFTGGLIAQYVLYSKLGLLNTFLVYILPTAFSFYNVIIIKTYINTIPNSIEESAKIDGSTEIGIFFKMILPLSKPILATIGLWLIVGAWNDWTTTLYFVTKKNLFTLQYILMQLIKEGEKIAAMIQQANLDGVTVSSRDVAMPESIKAAQIIIITLPIIMTYPFLQKYFIKGIMIGSVKE